jgi:hypothetical protein
MALDVTWVFVFLTTNITFKKFFFRMHFDMSIENSHGRETFIALWTRKFFRSMHCFNVALQSMLISEDLFAVVAFYWCQGTSAMNSSDVLFQGRLGTLNLQTKIAP